MVKPLVLAIILCDSVIREAQTNKLSLIGTFNGIFANHFPCTHPTLSVYIALTGHLFGGTITAYSKKEWDGYTDPERKIVGEAAKLGQDINRALSVVRDQESLAAYDVQAK